MSDENVRDRREMLLQAVGDGDADSINPRDYTEKLLAEAAEGEDTRSNAREHIDKFINAITGGSGSGGNYILTQYDFLDARDIFTGESGPDIIKAIQGTMTMDYVVIGSFNAEEIGYNSLIPVMGVPGPSDTFVFAPPTIGWDSDHNVYRYAVYAPVLIYYKGDQLVPAGSLVHLYTDMDDDITLAESVPCSVWVAEKVGD